MSRYMLLTVILLVVVPTLGMAQPANLAEAEAKAKADSPFKAEEIMTLAPAKLIAILKDREASEFAKAKACQRLALVGDKTAVPALAALLGDPKLSHYARYALEPISDPAVDKAFRDALGKLKGDLLCLGCRAGRDADINPAALGQAVNVIF